MGKYDFEMDLNKNTSTGMIMSQMIPGTYVLEFGCAEGRMTKYMSEKMNCHVHIIEQQKDDYQKAIAYAEDGCCCDVDEMEWTEKFDGNLYDYIIFANVFEYLSNPEKVLARTKDFLKDDGHILITVPNITHNDIILKMYQDRFTYTETGLLDNTHIHFWGYDDINQMFNRAGFIVYVENGTRCNTSYTEQVVEKSEATDSFTRLMSSRLRGDVDQFFFSLVKKEYAVKRISYIAKQAKVYFELGDSYSKDNYAFIISENSTEQGDSYHFSIPEGCKKLYFYPYSGSGIMIHELQASCDYGSIRPSRFNGMEIDNGYWFSSDQPWLEFDFTKKCNTMFIHLRYDLCPDDFVNQRYEKLLKDLKHKKNLLDNMENVLNNTRYNLENARKDVDFLNKALADTTAAMRYHESLVKELRMTQSWKVTAPLRAITGNLKKLKNIKKPEQGNDVNVDSAMKNGNLLERASKENQIIQDSGQKPVFEKKILFSILVPLYNTQKDFLRDMIKSLEQQTYNNWELCMADGSDSNHGYIEKICRSLAEKDHRIKYKKLDKNRGISENTNACLEMAEGDYIGLLDHDDVLHPSALFEVMKQICCNNADFIYTDEATFESPEITKIIRTHYKSDYAPDMLRSYNYICHFTVFSRELQKQVGGFRKECDGSQDYDLILRLTEKAQHIVHIPKALYYWRASVDSTASDISAKPYIMDAAKKALSDHMQRIGLVGSVKDTAIPSVYKIDYEIIDKPLISILIPNYEHTDLLKQCINSVLEKTTYPNYEIVVVENNSKMPEIFEYYERIEKNPKVRVINLGKREFNYSFINNEGFRHCKGEYIVLLNNDIEVITDRWLEEMLMFAQRPDVGAVGAMLYYPSNKVQHAGVILGLGGVAGHSHKFYNRGDYGYFWRMCLVQNLSAVTAACMMVPRKVYEEINGLDEAYAVAFNDVDFCMRIRKAGYLITWTPFAELYHYESESRGLEDTPEKVERFNDEKNRFQKRWDKELKAGDPYYNPNLTLDREDFSEK